MKRPLRLCWLHWVVSALALLGPGAKARADEPEDRRTGIELVWRSLRATPPKRWGVVNSTSGARVARVEQRWGFTAVPPGTYTVDADFEGASGVARGVEVRLGNVTRITPGDLGLGQLMVELPAARGIVLIHGASATETQLVEAGSTRRLAPGSPTDPQVTTWAREGKATVRFHTGSSFLDVPVDVVRGETRHVPFDAEKVAARLGLSAVSVSLRDEAGKPVRQDAQVMFVDSKSGQLLAIATDPPPGSTWLLPPGPIVRARVKDRAQTRRNVPAGPKADVVFDFNPAPKPGGPVKILVDVKIESPADGTVVDKPTTPLIGRASSTGPAGALRIALVADVSNSARDSSGADLDGDGREDSIIQAEAAAGRLLLGELERVEAKTPGTAFEVTVLRFADRAETLAPLTRMTDTEGVRKLREALEEIARRGSMGGTDYVAAIDEATRALKAKERPGPCVVLFMSDGGPNQLRPSLDAAARTGLAGVTIHTIGLGKAFLGQIEPQAAFPPEPSNPVNILATIAALGAPVGSVTALPLPADIVQVIPRLPVLELPEAELKEVQVVNQTTGKPALSVQVSPDGAFQAEVPVSLLPTGSEQTNTLVATAIAKDGVSKASDRVTVKCPPLPGTLRVVYQARPGGPPLPRSLMPACELILDSSKSMVDPVDKKPKFQVARTVMGELLDGLPDGTYVGLRLYGHLGFLQHRPGRPLPKVDPKDPRLSKDSQLVEPIDLLDAARRRRIKKAIDDAWPRGNTPLCYSLLEAKADFPSRWQGTKLVILVSDGEENCGGKLVDVADAYRKAGIAITVHVVGFNIQGAAAKQQLEELARIGGGRYFDARDARQLAEALREAVASAEYVVSSADGKTEVARGTINGPGSSLMPGAYRVALAGSREAALPVRIGNRQRVEVAIDEMGQLVEPRQPAPAGSTRSNP